MVEKHTQKNKQKQFIDFVEFLKEKGLTKLTENELKKEIIIYFNISDFRVITNKINVLIALELIRKSYEDDGFRLGVVYYTC